MATGIHPIKVIDVHKGKNKEKIQVILRTSKTHTLGDLPQVIKIESMGSKVEKKCTEADGKYSSLSIQNN